MTSPLRHHRDIAWACDHLTRQLIIRRRVTSDEYLVISLKFKNFFQNERKNILEFGSARFEISSSIESNATENRRRMEKGYFSKSCHPMIICF